MYFPQFPEHLDLLVDRRPPRREREAWQHARRARKDRAK